MNETRDRTPSLRWAWVTAVIRVPIYLLAGGLAGLFLVACGHQATLGGPRITALNAKGSSDRPISIRGNVIDASTGLPVQLAHVSYAQHVLNTDASGGFSLSGVPPNEKLNVVSAGYWRYVGDWDPANPQIKLTPLEVRSIYMPFRGLTDPTISAAVDDLTKGTEINSVVVEIKTDDGQVSTQMATPEAIAAHAAVDGVDLKGFVQKMHSRGMYVIGRFVVFRDPYLASAHPEYALRRLDDGQIFEDEQGQKWIDAFRQEVWTYNLDIAEKAAQLGIDEIQFDYVRFPGADSPLRYAEPMTQDDRVAAVSGFLKMADGRLRPYGIAIGADTFGLTTIAKDDTGIGQDIESLARYIDYYCPMVYPSTWADGSLGVPYPPADPYTIVHDSVEAAVQRLAKFPTVKVRPWLQAFDDYKSRQLDYTPDRVNIQKLAGTRAGGVGWMLWHPGARYDAGAIGPSPSGTTTVLSH